MSDDIGHPQYTYPSNEFVPTWIFIAFILGTVLALLIMFNMADNEHPCDYYSSAEQEQCNETYQTGPEPDYNM